MKSILIFDNYDSFTYNLYHLLEKVSNDKIEVRRNDKISVEEINKYDKILLSPGPGIPSEAGILLDVIKKYSSTKSILGICLGQQAIAEAFGGSIVNLDKVFHGVSTPISIKVKDIIFENLPEKIKVGRYHSWVVDKNNFPIDLEITAEDDSGNVMALRHKNMDVRSVQFHPESILTGEGETILKNWIRQ
jgi:anthranilate synthase component 2